MLEGLLIGMLVFTIIGVVGACVQSFTNFHEKQCASKCAPHKSMTIGRDYLCFCERDGKWELKP